MSDIQVMLDLETLSSEHNASILSIGAVKFDMLKLEIVDSFQCAIDPLSSEAFKLHISASTVMWWMDNKRDEARRRLLLLQPHDLPTALDGFAQWFGTQSLPVWGNGSDFDNVILHSSYAAIGLECPWKFWHNRCFRTLKTTFAAPIPLRKDEGHDALDDAIFQTQWLFEIMRGVREV